MAWTVFEYLYRDADNYKAYGEVAFEGVADDAQWEAALQTLDEGTYFVAEQIGLPALYAQLYRWSGNVATDADHCWHEFVSLSHVGDRALSAKITRIATAAEFVDRLRKIESWNIFLSPNA